MLANSTHLYAELGKSAEELNLVFWDDLGEGYEEAGLKSHHAVV